jgi:phage shock protein PspC (stress-responsive transcriptional regulator)
MKQLYRSKTQRILGGICGGLGHYLDIDPTLIRVIWAVISLFTLGIGILTYIVAWILIPEEGASDNGTITPLP